MNNKFIILLGILFLSFAKFSFGQDDNFKKELREHLEQSLSHFESIKEERKNREGIVYESKKYLPGGTTELYLDYRKNIFFSKSKVYPFKKMAEMEAAVNQYKKQILAVLPSAYKSKRAFAYQLKAEINSTGAIMPDYSKTIRALCFYHPSEQKSKPNKYPKLFLFWYPKDNSQLEIFVVAPQNGKSISKPKMGAVKNSSINNTPTKERSSNKSYTKESQKSKEIGDKYEMSDVTGTYIGYYRTDLFKKEKGKFKLEVRSDYTATLSAQIQGVWMEMKKTNLKKKYFRKNATVKNTITYYFEGSNKEFSSLAIYVMGKRIFDEYNGHIMIILNDGASFEMKREGGNPKYSDLNNNGSSGNNASTPVILKEMAKIYAKEIEKNESKVVITKSGVFSPSVPYSLSTLNANKKYGFMILTQSNTATPSLCGSHKKMSFKLLDSRLYSDKKRMFRTHMNGVAKGKSAGLQICFSEKVEAEILIFEVND